MLQIHLFVLLFTVVASFSRANLTPSPRWSHAAVLIANKIYFYGGKTGYDMVSENNAQNTNDLLVLDVSFTFALSAAPWAFAQPSSSLYGPLVANHTITYGGPSYSQLIVYGGQLDSDSANYTGNYTDDTSLWIYDIETDVWLHPNVSSPTRRFGHTMVTRADSGKSFVFGGMPLNNDLFSLDVKELSWSPALPLQLNTPSPRYHHTSTLLQDGRMIVIGGFDGTMMVDMTDIRVLDTSSLQWSAVIAAGNVPEERRDHTAVATHDGNVIIYGGTNETYMEFFSDIAVLNCSNSSQFAWSRPQVSGTVPAGRYTHTATMVGTRMIVAFGFLETMLGDSNIYALDTLNYTWLASYTPEDLNYTAVGMPTDNGAALTIPLVAALVSAFAALFLISLGSWYLVRRRRRSLERGDVVRSPGRTSPEMAHRLAPILTGQTTRGTPPASPRSQKSVSFVDIPPPMRARETSSDLEEQARDMDMSGRSFPPKRELRVMNPDDV